MKKTFTLQGLDCANCAAKVERKVAKLPGVEHVTVTFFTQRMELEADGAQMDRVAAEAAALIRKLEPDVVVKERR